MFLRYFTCVSFCWASCLAEEAFISTKFLADLPDISRQVWELNEHQLLAIENKKHTVLFRLNYDDSELTVFYRLYSNESGKLIKSDKIKSSFNELFEKDYSLEINGIKLDFSYKDHLSSYLYVDSTKFLFTVTPTKVEGFPDIKFLDLGMPKKMKSDID